MKILYNKNIGKQSTVERRRLMGKQCARRVFAVFMVLFLTVGILTFPSDAQEAA